MSIKPLLATTLFLALFFYCAFFHDYLVFDALNLTPANPSDTPAHIYPEWYFLWSYEVLRGIFFSADLGLIAFGIANVIFFVLPWLDRDPSVKPAHKRPLFRVWFWLLIVVMIGLTVYGKLPPTGINAWIGFVFSISFLALLLVVLPLISAIERKRG